MKNYYQILGVANDARFEQIKSAFRKLAKKCHPDVSEDCGGDFRVLKNAFDTLSNPEKRRRYDIEAGIYKPLANSFRSYRVNVPPIVQDIYDDLLDVFTDRFRIPGKRVLNFELFLNDHEFAQGAKSSITIPQEKICPRCFGFGGSLLHLCRNCRGSGLIDYNVDFDIILKPPLEPGQVYELRKGKHLLRFKLRRGDVSG